MATENVLQLNVHRVNDHKGVLINVQKGEGITEGEYEALIKSLQEKKKQMFGDGAEHLSDVTTPLTLKVFQEGEKRHVTVFVESSIKIQDVERMRDLLWHVEENVINKQEPVGEGLAIEAPDEDSYLRVFVQVGNKFSSRAHITSEQEAEKHMEDMTVEVLERFRNLQATGTQPK